MSKQSTLGGFESEADAVVCDECGEAINGEPLVVIRECDNETLSICPIHIAMR